MFGKMCLNMEDFGESINLVCGLYTFVLSSVFFCIGGFYEVES